MLPVRMAAHRLRIQLQRHWKTQRLGTRTDESQTAQIPAADRFVRPARRGCGKVPAVAEGQFPNEVAIHILVYIEV